MVLTVSGLTSVVFNALRLTHVVLTCLNNNLLSLLSFQITQIVYYKIKNVPLACLELNSMIWQTFFSKVVEASLLQKYLAYFIDATLNLFVV